MFEGLVEVASLELKKEIKTRTDDFNDLLIEIIKAKPKKQQRNIGVCLNLKKWKDLERLISTTYLSR
jgi:hypothetical protein